MDNEHDKLIFIEKGPGKLVQIIEAKHGNAMHCQGNHAVVADFTTEWRQGINLMVICSVE